MIPRRIDLFQYAFPALPLAFAGLPLYVHAPDYYTRELGLGIGLIGVILMAVRLLDAVQDPVIGYLGDRFADARALQLLGGAALLAIGMAAVFFGPPSGLPVAVWFAASMVLATTGFSVISIHLTLIGGLWRPEYDQRTRISAWREAFSLTGLLVASALPAALLAVWPPAVAYCGLFWVFLGLALPAIWLFQRFWRSLPANHGLRDGSLVTGADAVAAPASEPARFAPWALFRPLLGPDRLFFAVCFLSHLAAALPGVLVLFFIRDYLQADHLAGLFLFLYFAAGAACMPLWVRLADRWGRERAWLGAMILAVTAFAWALLLGPGDVWAYGVICVLSGMALGADLALPPGMLADRITARGATAQATRCFALLAFLPKTALALASGGALLVLGQLDFVAGAAMTGGASAFGLLVLYAGVPSLIKLCAAGLLWRLCHSQGEGNETAERIEADGTAWHSQRLRRPVHRRPS